MGMVMKLEETAQVEAYVIMALVPVTASQDFSVLVVSTKLP
jgi:hypothetical protein